MMSSQEATLPVLSLLQNDFNGVAVPAEIRLDEFDEEDKLEIGRAMTCKVQIFSLQVSRFHATIKRKKENEAYSYFVVDKSTNGLRINSLTIAQKVEVEFKLGDVIDLVPNVLKFKFEMVVDKRKPLVEEPSPSTSAASSSSAIIQDIYNTIDEVLLDDDAEEEPVLVVRKKKKRTMPAPAEEDGEWKKTTEDLELEIQRLKLQNEMLKTELDWIKDEKEQSDLKSANLIHEAKVVEVLESEWTCVICDVVFIDPSTLPCGHTFCQHCLRQWLSKKQECPVCREKCVGTGGSRNILVVKKSVSIACMIERTYSEILPSEESRKKREETLKEREEEVKEASRVPIAPAAVPPPPPFIANAIGNAGPPIPLMDQVAEFLQLVGGGRRGRSRRQPRAPAAGGRGRGRGRQQPPAPIPPQVLLQQGGIMGDINNYVVDID